MSAPFLFVLRYGDHFLCATHVRISQQLGSRQGNGPQPSMTGWKGGGAGQAPNGGRWMGRSDSWKQFDGLSSGEICRRRRRTGSERGVWWNEWCEVRLGRTMNPRRSPRSWGNAVTRCRRASWGDGVARSNAAGCESTFDKWIMHIDGEL